MRRVVICGGGFGGIAIAKALRGEFPRNELQVVLVDRRPTFVMGLRKTWQIVGLASLAEGRRELSLLEEVDVRIGEIESIDPRARAVTVAGDVLEGEWLVIALGADHAMDAVPGLAQHGIDAWDGAQAERAGAALAQLTGGRLLVGVFGTPYACPPGPYELALLARDRLPPPVEVAVFSPTPIALPVVGPHESAKLERMLEAAGVSLLLGRAVTEVSAGEVRFADGSREAFDLLLAVPPHRCPKLLLEAGLAEAGGWVKPDPRTLETRHPGVFAVGDCTAVPLANGMALPKAGIIAQLEGEVVARRIAAALRGEDPRAEFTGDAFCYLETGRGRAAQAAGNFYADPPAVTISDPSVETLEAKREFERSRLAKWFGG